MTLAPQIHRQRKDRLVGTTRDVSNIEYFGDPTFTYSRRQRIDDGFLAAHQVNRIDLDKDLDGWRPKYLAAVRDLESHFCA